MMMDDDSDSDSDSDIVIMTTADQTFLSSFHFPYISFSSFSSSCFFSIILIISCVHHFFSYYFRLTIYIR